MRYQHADSHIVHDTFDDEVVIIDLESGFYYSLTGSGPAVWGLLRVGATGEEVAAALAAGGAHDGAEVRRVVGEFLDALERESLISRIGDRLPGDSPAGARTTVASGGGVPRAAFTPPVLTKYSDQRELLLLDPIHEVGDLGWPEKK